MKPVETEYSLKVMEYYVNTLSPERMIVLVLVPTTSNQVISPKHFETFPMPYQQELHEKILDMGIKHIFCHICGDQNMNLLNWSKIPMGAPGIVSFGHEIDFTTALKYFGDTCIIAGNIEPALIQEATP